jgi:FkbM family methyltransferase
MTALRVPWAVQFVRRHLPYMTLPSACRYLRLDRRRIYGRAAGPQLLRLRLKPPMPGDVWVRHGTSDLRTLAEVVFARVYRPVVEAVPGCEYVLDLGANVGLASRFFAAAYPTCRLLAVEPDERNLALYRRNMGCVPAARWEVLRAAVWRADEPVALGLPPDGPDYGAGFDSIRVGPDHGSGGPTVPGLTPATLIERSGFPRVDLLKMDVEGAEAELFRGDTGWLDRVRAVAVEFHGDSRERSGFDAAVTDRGFAVRTLNEHTTLATKGRRGPS